jgi:hypothetical protein
MPFFLSFIPCLCFSVDPHERDNCKHGCNRAGPEPERTPRPQSDLQKEARTDKQENPNREAQHPRWHNDLANKRKERMSRTLLVPLLVNLLQGGSEPGCRELVRIIRGPSAILVSWSVGCGKDKMGSTWNAARSGRDAPAAESFQSMTVPSSSTSKARPHARHTTLCEYRSA